MSQENKVLEPDKVVVELTQWECQRIVLALLNQNNSLPGTSALFTMREMANMQEALK